MTGKTVAPRIKKYADKYLDTPPSFLLLLRNPIDYLNSHFEMHKQHNFFKKNPEKYPNPPENLIEFIKKFPQYIERAKYYKILNEYWLTYFNLEQFKIISFDDFIRHKDKNIKEILETWDLQEQTLEVSKVSQNRLLKYPFLKKWQKFVIKNERIKNILKKNKIFIYLYNSFLTQKSSSLLSAQDRQYLKEILKEDVSKLKQLCKKDFPYWQDFKDIA